jgi:hypothetical protein
LCAAALAGCAAATFAFADHARARSQGVGTAASLSIGQASQWAFNSSVASDIEPLFMEQAAGWLGADIATSVSLGWPSGSGGGGGSGNVTQAFLWLFGDTLNGTMLPDGSRDITSMPRNSVGILSVSADGSPAGTLVHSVRGDRSQPVHVGFFTPPGGNESQWYWPTAGAAYNGSVYVFAYRMAPSDAPLFAFQTVGIDVLSLGAPAPGSDPVTWPPPAVAPLPNINNTFTIGNAVAVSEVDGFLYLLGGSGNPQSAIMARVPLAGLVALDWAGLQYWTGEAGDWQAWDGGMAPALLFDDVPSETTLQFHPALGAWFIVVANTFLSDSQ